VRTDVCRICHRPLTRHQAYADRICGDWRCRERLLRDELEARRSEAGAALGERAANAFPIVVVPYNRRALVPVSDAEREELRAFLEEQLAELCTSAPSASPAGPDSATPDPAPAAAAAPAGDLYPAAGAPGHSETVASLLGKVCGACEGYCCHHGATRHAFLDRRALETYVVRHPEVPAGQVVSRFIEWVPPQHGDGSCLYHTERGCNLPRDMRAAICNEYECKGLRETRDLFAKTGAARVFVVSRVDRRIQRSAFVEVR